jgi:hypothetical protein
MGVCGIASVNTVPLTIAAEPDGVNPSVIVNDVKSECNTPEFQIFFFASVAKVPPEDPDTD